MCSTLKQKKQKNFDLLSWVEVETMAILIKARKRNSLARLESIASKRYRRIDQLRLKCTKRISSERIVSFSRKVLLKWRLEER